MKNLIIVLSMLAVVCLFVVVYMTIYRYVADIYVQNSASSQTQSYDYSDAKCVIEKYDYSQAKCVPERYDYGAARCMPVISCPVK